MGIDVGECVISQYEGKRVLVTGSTGFKGSWLCKMLTHCNAEVMGYAVGIPGEPALYELSGLNQQITSVMGDIRDLAALQRIFQDFRPEIVFHLAAQPIVRESYQNPVYTYETNVMGTVNILECIRTTTSVKSFINVTTDKVYLNREWEWGYREEEPLDGFDPYSNSKSCSELVTHSYKNSFFSDGRVAISTARAGNVIGGGDFAMDRIIPDIVRAIQNQETIIVRNPYSIRPYQYVLEPLYVYMMIAALQMRDGCYAGYYNVGPDESDCYTTGELADLFVKEWGNGLKWIVQAVEGPHEANFLKLDSSKLKSVFGWKPVIHAEEAIEKIVEWTRCYLEQEDVIVCMDKQIKDFFRKRS